MIATRFRVARRHSWALVIATYERNEILQECISRALQQTCRPKEVIVVDASREWERSREATLNLHVARNPDVRFEHVQAGRAAVAYQRNQGLALARADVVFMIDDDSMMHPDCAEHILEVYDADAAGEVAGVQAAVVDDLPGAGLHCGFEPKATGASRWEWIRGNRLAEFLYSYLLLMNSHELFLPYEGAFPELCVPATVAHLGVMPVYLFWGCAMTFRRDVISKVQFEAQLLRYCPGDELDASYRASLRGALLVATNARLRHLAAAGGRTNRFVATALSATNQAYLLRKHGNDGARDRGRFRRLMLRRFLAEGLKDGLSGRWTLPQLRGIVYSLGVGERMFRTASADCELGYAEFQERLLARR